MSRLTITRGSLGRRYLECAAFVLLWMAAEVYLRLTPLQAQYLGIPLIVLFQVAIARRPLRQLWARDATSWPITGRFMAVAAALAAGCVVLLWVGHGHAAAGLSDRRALGALAVVASLPAAFAICEQRSAAFRRGLGFAIAAVIVRVVWYAVWHEHVLIPGGKWVDFFTLWLCEFTGLFLFDEVAFRGALDPHVASATTGRLPALGSAVFISILWALWHLPAYNPHVRTFPGLFLAINPIAFLQVIMGTLLSFCARSSRTLVLPCVVHAFGNAYVLALM